MFLNEKEIYRDNISHLILPNVVVIQLCLQFTAGSKELNLALLALCQHFLAKIALLLHVICSEGVLRCVSYRLVKNEQHMSCRNKRFHAFFYTNALQLINLRQ